MHFKKLPDITKPPIIGFHPCEAYNTIHFLIHNLHPTQGQQKSSDFKCRVHRAAPTTPPSPPNGLVVLIHGLGGCPQHFDEYMDHLKQQYLITAAFTLPGHDNKDPDSLITDTHHYEDFILKVQNVLTQFNKKHPHINIHIIGLSFGSAFARALTEKCSDFIQSCQFISPFTDPYRTRDQYLLRTLNVLDTILPLGTLTASCMPTVSRNRSPGITGKPELSALGVFTAWKFAQATHTPLTLFSPSQTVTTDDDRIVCLNSFKGFYPGANITVLPGLEHQVFRGIDAKNKKKLFSRLDEGRERRPTLNKPPVLKSSLSRHRTVLIFSLALMLTGAVTGTRAKRA